MHTLVLGEVYDGVTEDSPQVAEFQRALADRPAEDLPLLRRLASSRPAADPDEQFEFGLTCLLSGMAALLAR